MKVFIHSNRNKYLGRKICRSKINTIANNPENWNVFIKSVEDLKRYF